MIEEPIPERCNGYYGVPTKEILEGITENIGDARLPEDSSDVLCLQLRFSGVKYNSNSIIFPSECWERICKTEDASVSSEGGQADIKNLVDQLKDLAVPFGDYVQIIEMLRTNKYLDDGGKMED